MIITFLVAVVLAEKPANKRATPAYKPAPAYPAPESYPAPGYSKSYDYVSIWSVQLSRKSINIWSFYQPAQPYNFAYDVKDDPSYNNFGHQENADGKVVSGSYRVVLPDGRTQVHTYKDEGYGLVASVKTEGAIKTYDYKPAYKASAYPAPYSPKY